ncbi:MULTISPECIES: hypothetical protein [Herbaspirillum]|uniref:DUF2491 family protein n=2 Tax=Herbaspirillum huttiense TaxID=863372 RepID=A0AAJ2LVC3_9BURK|nr:MULTISPECIES: hypothetical protein [Herbaspirillum]MDR9836866.1 hypothetical protein [Herbaspirillum huttiense]
MSWKNAFSYLGRLSGRGKSRDEVSADAGLPLGLRIGSLVSIKSGYYLAMDQRATFVRPLPAAAAVKAISSLSLNMDLRVHRFWIETGDSGVAARFLQITSALDGTPKEAFLCSLIARYVPVSVEEQDIYTGANQIGLGEREFAVQRDSIDQRFYSADEIEKAFGDSVDLVFRRDVGGSENFVAPFTGVEIRIDDSRGERGLEQSVWFMPYFRRFGGISEHLFITTANLTSRNGRPEREVYVDFVAGLPVPLTDLAVV